MRPFTVRAGATRLAALGTTVLLIAGTRAGAASFPPELRFRTITNDRLSVHFHQGLEPMAREAATLGAEILTQHEQRYRQRVGRVHIVIADLEDDPNGFATPLPYPLVTIHAAAPDGADSFGNHEGWLRLALAHELAHVVDLEEARGAWRFGRKVFGRAPFVFPGSLAMTWMVEGLATFEETRLTAFGRGRNPDSRMVLRMAALEHRFPRPDQAIYAFDAWPGGQTPYLFGEAFLRRLTELAGEDAVPRLGSQLARQVPYLDGRAVKAVTGRGLDAQWREWASAVAQESEQEAAARRGRGLTGARALTTRGVRQREPRFSPDGSWIAYTSGTLARFPEIRLVRPDGSGDHRLAPRNGGSGLAWTPDGREVVFAELQVHRTFSLFGDLSAARAAGGRVRRLTRGIRAYDAEVSPDGKSVVFVRKLGDHSDLFRVGLDGSGLRAITSSLAGVEWSGPRFSPGGDRIAASRLLPGGWLDIVLVNPRSGAVEQLTHDRAKDVEPTWTPDGAAIVFCSDRDGVSNLYAVRPAGGPLFRVTNVLGGAFAPSVSPDGKTVAFSSYSSRGYDVVVAPLDLPSAAVAPPFEDANPSPHADPPPADTASTAYRPGRTLWPRFWSPWIEGDEHESRIGFASGGSDPLFRHAWTLRGTYGTATDRVNVAGGYRYDRFRTTLLVSGQVKADIVDQAREPGSRAETTAERSTRQLDVQAALPIRRTVRSLQSLSLAYRREREEVAGRPEKTHHLGGLETAWTLTSARSYPYSISPSEGGQLRLGWLHEARALGGEISLDKIAMDARWYRRLFGARDVLALRLGGGTTRGGGDLVRSFVVGGYPSGGLLDLSDTNSAVLRGYSTDPRLVLAGRRFAAANLEYRFPLLSPQRGWRSLPVFMRHWHGTVFFDAATAWTGDFRWQGVRRAAGASLGLDSAVGFALPATAELTVAHGFDETGDTKVYLRLGLAF